MILVDFESAMMARVGWGDVVWCWDDGCVVAADDCDKSPRTADK